jgi:hypothetical protein
MAVDTNALGGDTFWSMLFVLSTHNGTFCDSRGAGIASVVSAIFSVVGQAYLLRRKLNVNGGT